MLKDEGVYHSQIVTNLGLVRQLSNIVREQALSTVRNLCFYDLILPKWLPHLQHSHLHSRQKGGGKTKGLQLERLCPFI